MIARKHQNVEMRENPKKKCSINIIINYFSTMYIIKVLCSETKEKKCSREFLSKKGHLVLLQIIQLVFMCIQECSITSAVVTLQHLNPPWNVLIKPWSNAGIGKNMCEFCATALSVKTRSSCWLPLMKRGFCSHPQCGTSLSPKTLQRKSELEKWEGLSELDLRSAYM